MSTDQASEGTEGVPWWVWAIGGATVVGGIGVIYVGSKAAVKVAPFALAYGAPEWLPHYQYLQEARKRGDVQARDAVIQQALAHFGRKQPTPYFAPQQAYYAPEPATVARRRAGFTPLTAEERAEAARFK